MKVFAVNPTALSRTVKATLQYNGIYVKNFSVYTLSDNQHIHSLKFCSSCRSNYYGLDLMPVLAVGSSSGTSCSGRADMLY